MSGPRLEIPSSTGSADDFEAAVARRVEALQDQGVSEAHRAHYNLEALRLQGRT